MLASDTILVTGGNGLAGRHLVEALQAEGFTCVISCGSSDCDLTDRSAVQAYFTKIKPNYVFHMAGHVFGIMGNMRNQAEAYLQNNLINTHIVDASYRSQVKKIVAMGTVAMYPDPLPSNPLREETIWQGEPHGSERGYAHAKRGMLAQLAVSCDTYNIPYACPLSTNLYGPHDRFNIETGHVIPSLVRKFYEAKKSSGKITVWGDGSATRDFLYIKDAARALRLIMDHVEGPINLATGQTYTIRDAVTILAAHTGMEDHVAWDTSKPNGQQFRAYDISRLDKIGFKPCYSLEQGLRETYDWYATNVESARK